MKKIDFEAHFVTEEYTRAMLEHKGYPRLVRDQQTGGVNFCWNTNIYAPFGAKIFEKLIDLGDMRLRNMDASGIDVQVLSLTAPGVEELEPAVGSALARETNDTLAKAIQKHPDRFMGFAALAPGNPTEAAQELERSVKSLGFFGWNTQANFGNSYLDEKKYWPILETAEKLGVPIYLHPNPSNYQPMMEYGFALAGPVLGFGCEAAMCMMRLIFSGVFDRFSRLTIILGHLGEGLPFFLKRIDWAYVRPWIQGGENPKLMKRPSDCLRENVFVTTSGNYFEPAFTCTHQAIGMDRILLASDYPYENMDDCIQFLDGLPISQDNKEKIYCRNASRIGVRLKDPK